MNWLRNLLLRTAWVTSVFAALLFSTVVEAAPLRKIGVSLSDLGNPFFVEIARGVEVAARELGGRNVEVIATSCAYDIDRQIEQVNRFIDMKVDLIIITAVDPVAIQPVIERAKAAGIFVLAVDVEALGANAVITTDNLQAGRVACEYIARRLDKGGNVLIINGPRISSVLERVRGCEESLSRHSRIKLVSANRDAGGSTSGGFAAMTDLISRYPEIDAVFCINDPTAIGADLASIQSHRQDYFIVGVDGAPKAVARIRGTGSRIAATVAQRPRTLARTAVDIGIKLMNGQPVAQTRILVPTFLVTRQTPGFEQGRWAE